MTRHRLAQIAIPFLASMAMYGCTIVTNPNRGTAQVPPSPPPPPPAQTTVARTPAQPTATPRTSANPKLSMRRPPGGGLRTVPPHPQFQPVPANHPPMMVVHKPMTAPNVFGRPQVLVGGLRGDVFLLEPGARQLPNFDAMRQPMTTLYTADLNIAPQDFRAGFPGVSDRIEYFAIRYTGDFVVQTQGDYTFRLLSDDGSRLIIDNAPILNNDGVHGPQDKSATIRLAPGTHHLEVDYFKGAKYQIALQLFVTEPGAPEHLFTPTGFGPKVTLPPAPFRH